MICKRTRPVLVLYERKSRVTLAARLVGKTAAETISVMPAVFARIEPTLRKSITLDNDTAFAQHALLKPMCAMTTWFCDAYASWQKGGVENANGANVLRHCGQVLRLVLPCAVLASGPAAAQPAIIPEPIINFSARKKDRRSSSRLLRK